MNLEMTRRDLKRREDAVQDRVKEVEDLRNAAEEALVLARQERDGVERERDEMLKGFQEIRTGVEVRSTRWSKGRGSVRHEYPGGHRSRPCNRTNA